MGQVVIIHSLLPLIDFGKFHIFPQFSHLYRGTHRNVGYIQLEEILKEEEREMQTKRGGDRHRAEQKAEEAKVSGKRGEQMEQGAGQTERRGRWGQ